MPDIVKSGALATIERDMIEEFCRAQCHVATLDGMAICRVLGKYNLYVPLTDDSITPHLMMNGYWETWLTQAVARHVRPGMRCIDVGACLGYYTLLLADLVGEGGFVEAWEPSRRAYSLLCRSVKLNGFGGRISCLAIGASNADADFVLAGDPRDWASQHLVPAPAIGLPPVAVRTAALDGLVRSGPIDFVKIDAEGHEKQVWEGMTGLFGSNREIAVMMEWSQPEDPVLGAARVRYVDFAGKLVDRAPAGEPKTLWITHA